MYLMSRWLVGWMTRQDRQDYDVGKPSCCSLILSSIVWSFRRRIDIVSFLIRRCKELHHRHLLCCLFWNVFLTSMIMLLCYERYEWRVIIIFMVIVKFQFCALLATKFDGTNWSNDSIRNWWHLTILLWLAIII